jgi:hypothetical protein
MSVHSVPGYEIRCDWPDCDIRTFDVNGEFAFWADVGQAEDDWNNGDGITDHKRGKHYCPNHAAKVCAECFSVENLTEGDDQWLYCPDHIKEHADG